jgi:hypothetical protein
MLTWPIDIIQTICIIFFYHNKKEYNSTFKYKYKYIYAKINIQRNLFFYNHFYIYEYGP